MKPEEFERLKELCAKEGFIVSRGGMIPGESILVEVYKDPWEGVEFASVANEYAPIYKIVSKDSNFLQIYSRGLVDPEKEGEKITSPKNHFNPSTEEAYAKQLKDEARKRFREIKVWDQFDTDYYDETLRIDDGYGLGYRKSDDTLFYLGWSIYQAGKWAKKLPEMIKVAAYYDASRKSMDCNLKVDFIFSKHVEFKEVAACKFLSSQLEKFLNGEIKKEVGNE